jgi:transaldolase/glucose-6-phosphate isomerase
MNGLRALEAQGQSVWLDFIRRSLFDSGELGRLIEEDGLSGLTANPTIFEKAIAESAEYDGALAALLAASPSASTQDLYEALAIDDIQRTADLLRPTYDRTRGADGFVSLEVSPMLAHDTAGTIAEARRLWAAVERPNLLIKVPGTAEGIPAIESLVASGISVNVTLLFNGRWHAQAMDAYLRGLARAPDPAAVASVASFFVSRVDTFVDRLLDRLGTEEARSLRGKAGIANARLAYARFAERFGSEEFARLRARGARVQRVLWASTSVKDPRYRDTLYAEELAGPDTVDTMPPSLVKAVRDHGQVSGRTVDAGREEARAVVARLGALGIDLEEVGEALLAEGVQAFQESFRTLFAALDAKRTTVPAGGSPPTGSVLGENGPRVARRLADWAASAVPARIWAGDPTVWSGATPSSVTSRLGWLRLPETMRSRLPGILQMADEVRAAGFREVVLLGMGGSSLAPQVFAATFGTRPGFPRLKVLDSTHPDAIAALRDSLDVPTTLFLVSSKSGTTLEPNAFFHYFWQEAARARRDPGPQFVAITDPGTPLEALAHEEGFRQLFLADPTIGGRYSALTEFGLVPAALIGADVAGLVERAGRFAASCGPAVPATDNPALALGAAFGELARAGRDKLTIVTSPGLAAFPSWAEQLVAESTGKSGTGIVPVAGEVRPLDPRLGPDRTVAFLGFRSEADPAVAAALDAAERAGSPVLRRELADPLDLGAEMFCWELAVASAGAVLGIDPFSQPDVEIAKELTRHAMAGSGSGGAAGPAADSDASAGPPNREALGRWMALARPGDYVSIQAYLAPTPAHDEALGSLRAALRDRLRLTTQLGYGPRFLHSTGQLHKGGPPSGLFLQVVDRPVRDVEVPAAGYTFGSVIRAQAAGDAAALRQKGRRLLTVELGGDPVGGLARLADAVRA